MFFRANCLKSHAITWNVTQILRNIICCQGFFVLICRKRFYWFVQEKPSLAFIFLNGICSPSLNHHLSPVLDVDAPLGRQRRTGNSADERRWSFGRRRHEGYAGRSRQQWCLPVPQPRCIPLWLAALRPYRHSSDQGGSGWQKSRSEAGGQNSELFAVRTSGGCRRSRGGCQGRCQRVPAKGCADAGAYGCCRRDRRRGCTRRATRQG